MNILCLCNSYLSSSENTFFSKILERVWKKKFGQKCPCFAVYFVKIYYLVISSFQNDSDAPPIAFSTLKIKLRNHKTLKYKINSEISFNVYFSTKIVQQQLHCCTESRRNRWIRLMEAIYQIKTIPKFANFIKIFGHIALTW